jgi:cytochrome c-type biogenesis protein CcmF
MIVQEKRGMLKVWNVSLITATFTLALLGTFLVRSGILESIHAFGESTVGGYFLGLIAFVMLGSAALIVSRLDDLRSERRLDSLLSRESFFLVNNLVLVGLCFVVFWGTFFPLISEALTGNKASVGPPWFDRYTVPLAITLVLLSGIGPLLAWRSVTLSRLATIAAVPAAIALAVTIGLAAFTEASHSLTSLLLFGFAVFTVSAVTAEFVRGARARRAMGATSYPNALVTMVRRNRRRYGGYVVHAGIAVLLCGVAASSAFNEQRDVTLKPGETTRIDGYDMRYVRPTSELSNEKIDFGAVVNVRKDGEQIAVLHPERSYFQSSNPAMGPIGRFFGGESTSEVSAESNLRRDIWMAMQPDLRFLMPAIRTGNRRFADSPPRVQALVIASLSALYERRQPEVTFRVIVNPMVTWIWIGGLIVFTGALIALWPAGMPARRRMTSAYAARLGRELKQA